MSAQRTVLSDLTRQTLALNIYESNNADNVLFSITHNSGISDILTDIKQSNSNFGAQLHIYGQGSSAATTKTVNITSPLYTLLADLAPENSDVPIVFSVPASNFSVSSTYRCFVDLHFETHPDGVRTEFHRTSTTLKYTHTSRNVPDTPVLNYGDSTGLKDSASIAITSAGSGGDSAIFQLHLVYFIVGSGDPVEDDLGNTFGDSGNLQKVIYDVCSNDLDGIELTLSNNLIVPGLESGMVYDFMLYTSNAYGNSEMSNPIRLPIIPTTNAVQALSVSQHMWIGDTDGALISWQSPVKADAVAEILSLTTGQTYNGMAYDNSLNITSYKIYRKRDDATGWTLAHTENEFEESGVPSTEPSYTWYDASFVAGDDGHAFTYKIVPVNGYGDGDSAVTGNCFTYLKDHTVTGLSYTSGYSDARVLLSWNAPTLPANQSIAGYKVYRKLATAADAEYTLLSTRAPGQLTYNDLSNSGNVLSLGVEYTYAVETVIDLANFGSPSSVVLAGIINDKQTLSAYCWKIPSAPTGFIGSTDNQQIRFVWSSTDTQGIFDHVNYYIKVYELASDNTRIEVPIADISTTATNYTIDELTNGTSYDADLYVTLQSSVELYSDAAETTTSTIVSSNTPLIPFTTPGWGTGAAVSVTPGDSQIVVTWPAADALGNDSVKYSVTLSNVDDVEAVRTVTELTVTTYTFLSLSNGYEYIATVTPIGVEAGLADRAGSAISSNSAIPYTNPDAPAGLNYSYDTTDGSVTLSWEQPNWQGTSANGYEVFPLFSGGVDSIGSSLDTTSNTVSLTLYNLDIGTVYSQICVVAKGTNPNNSSDTLVSSNSLFGYIVPHKVAEAPTLSVSAASGANNADKTVTFSWDVPNLGGLALKHYVITLSGGVTAALTVNTTSYTATVSDFGVSVTAYVYAVTEPSVAQTNAGVAATIDGDSSESMSDYPKSRPQITAVTVINNNILRLTVARRGSIPTGYFSMCVPISQTATDAIVKTVTGLDNIINTSSPSDNIFIDLALADYYSGGSITNLDNSLLVLSNDQGIEFAIIRRVDGNVSIYDTTHITPV